MLSTSTALAHRTMGNPATVAEGTTALGLLTHEIACSICGAIVGTITVPTLPPAILGAMFSAARLSLRMAGVKDLPAVHELAESLNAAKLAELAQLRCVACHLSATVAPCGSTGVTR